MKKALVTGSERNIGSPLVKYLISENHKVRETDIKLTYQDNYLMADITHSLDLLPTIDEPYSLGKILLGDKTVSLEPVSNHFLDGGFCEYQVDIIYRKTEKFVLVCTRNGALIVEKVLNTECKNILNSLCLGERFVTLLQKLERAQGSQKYDSLV